MFLLLVSGFVCLGISFFSPHSGYRDPPSREREASSSRPTPAPASAPPAPASSVTASATSPGKLTRGQCLELDQARFVGSTVQGPTFEEQSWCCMNELLTCPEFDCASDFDGWSVTKRKWCCKYHAQGCTYL